MRVKICGVTDPKQGTSIVALGAKVLGFMCVSTSTRYIKPTQIKTIVDRLPSEIDKVGVFANAEPEAIIQIVKETGLTGVQLHGNESPQYCQQLKKLLVNNIELIKAFRIENAASLAEVENYYNCRYSAFRCLSSSIIGWNWCNYRLVYASHLPA
jgi:phosphoribosylanthranilate isomerase